MKFVDIWSKGEVFQYLQYLLKQNQVKDCKHLSITKGYAHAYYPECVLDWASRIDAENVYTISTGYGAPSSYSWPKCPSDCPKYEKARDFGRTLNGEVDVVEQNVERIPNPVVQVVGEILGNHYYSHDRLNTLFMESGAPGDPPSGSCVKKCIAWLKRCNTDSKVDAFSVLGKVLENFMEIDIEGTGIHDKVWLTNRGRIKKILTKYGLSYHQGGQIFGAKIGLSSRSLKEILASKDLSAVEVEFQRAVDNVESDPAAGITAACSTIESLCKVYIEDEGLEMPSKQTIKNLWKVVQEHIGLDPGSKEDQDILRILSGLISVVDGIGALRTHTSSAHGKGRKTYKLKPRHARLAIHAAHTLVFFVIETWETKKKA